MATSATGSAQITVAADGPVSGSIETTALDGTMAHIHIGAAGTNGPVIVPMSKTADGVWWIAPGAKLSAAQLEP